MASFTSPRPQQLRVLWRMHRTKGPKPQTCTAALHQHPHGRELRVYLEPEEADNLLHTEVQRFDFALLEEKAASLREVLHEQGWQELP